MVFSITQKLTAEEIEKQEQEFRKFVIDNPAEAEKAVSAFNDFFDGGAKDGDYWMSNFRWYTELVWKRLLTFDPDFVVEVAIKRQVPMALFLDYDVWRELMIYFHVHAFSDWDETVNLYTKMRRAFLESKAVIGKWKGQEVTVADLVKDITVLNSRPSDSITEAEFRSRLKQTMFPKDDAIFQRYAVAEPDVATDRLVGFINFFLGVDAEHIWYAIEAYFYPKPTVEAVSPAASPQKPAAPSGKSEILNSKSASPQGRGPAEAGKSVKPVAPSSIQIKKAIEGKYKQDKDGQFEDVAEVLGKLAELAEKYKDPKLAEMYYYDEKDGKFKWNV